MAENELVSVVLTNYNMARFLPYAVKSVIAQTYPYLELILVDDASTDTSLDVMDRLYCAHNSRFSDFEVVTRKKNGNLNMAINSGWPFVEGSYVVLFDADDVLLPDFVTQTMSHMRAAKAKDDRIGFVYTDNYELGHDGTRGGVMGAYPFDKARLFGHGVPAESYIAGNALTDYKALHSIMPLPAVTPKGEKHLRWKRIVDNGWKGYHLAEPLFDYRMLAGQMSGVSERVREARARGDASIPGMRINLGEVWPVHTDS